MKSGLSYDKGVFKNLSESLNKKVEDLEKAIEFRFIDLVGPKTVTNAREVSTFLNQTGNLRSSMGFVLAKDGEIIETGGFTQVAGNGENKGKSGDGQNGVQAGRKYAEELARSSGRGYVLIVVAGMNYAGYVETKGYDVLTQSGTFLESEVRKMINDILKDAGFR